MLEGFDVGEEEVELYCANEECVLVQKDMLEDALDKADMDTSLESVTSNGPVMLDMMLCGNKVLSLTVSCPE